MSNVNFKKLISDFISIFNNSFYGKRLFGCVFNLLLYSVLLVYG